MLHVVAERVGASRQHRANDYIEELSLGPGAERTLKVYFCAAPPALDAVGTAGYGSGDDEDTFGGKSQMKSRVGARGGRDGKRPAVAMAAVAEQRRGSDCRGGGNQEVASAAYLATTRSGATKLSKQAFKLFFMCQEPRGQWDDGEYSYRFCRKNDGEGTACKVV